MVNRTLLLEQVCKTCSEDIEVTEKRDNFKKLVATAEQHPLARYQGLLASMKKEIEEDVPKLKDLLEEIGEEHTKENELDVQVVSYFFCFLYSHNFH